jgi:hypothetical protein
MIGLTAWNNPKERAISSIGRHLMRLRITPDAIETAKQSIAKAKAKIQASILLIHNYLNTIKKISSATKVATTSEIGKVYFAISQRVQPTFAVTARMQKYTNFIALTNLMINFADLY